jgi:hypothetical protein
MATVTVESLSATEIANWAATIETHGPVWQTDDKDREQAILFSRRVLKAFAERDAQIAEMRIELKCRLGIIKQMRQMAFDARAKVATMIFGVEELAISEENRIAEPELTEADDAK